MTPLLPPNFARSRLALLLLAALFLVTGRASAQDCGGPLSGSTGNVVGSVAGAVGGGLLGSQFGGGSGKGVMTGLGVVGGALAGGYVGRQAEGCNSRRPAAAQAASGGYAARSCRYVSNSALIDGQNQQVEGVACLQPDGAWRMATGPAANQSANTDLVLRSQQQLHDRGFYVRNNIDGRWGAGTSTAVRNFQQANGMAPSGVLDQPTQAALGVGPVALADLGQNGQAAAQAPAPAPDQGNQTAAQPPVTTPAAAPAASDSSSSIYK